MLLRSSYLRRRPWLRLASGATLLSSSLVETPILESSDCRDQLARLSLVLEDQRHEILDGVNVAVLVLVFAAWFNGVNAALAA